MVYLYLLNYFFSINSHALTKVIFCCFFCKTIHDSKLYSRQRRVILSRGLCVNGQSRDLLCGCRASLEWTRLGQVLGRVQPHASVTSYSPPSRQRALGQWFSVCQRREVMWCLLTECSCVFWHCWTNGLTALWDFPIARSSELLSQIKSSVNDTTASIHQSNERRMK